MSLEDTLAANTAALAELTRALDQIHARLIGMQYGATLSTDAPDSTTTASEAPARKRGRTKPGIREDVPATAENAAESAAESAPEAVEAVEAAPVLDVPAPIEEVDDDTPAPVAAVTYEQVSEAVTTVVKTRGRQVAVDVLGQFGLVKATQAKPDQYADLLAALRGAM